MKSINYNGAIYVNGDRDGLLLLGLSEGEASAVMLEFAKADAEQSRDDLLKVAALRIAPLQDALDLGKATDAEKSSLTAWKEYRVELGRISEQEGYPSSVIWPDAPSA